MIPRGGRESPGDAVLLFQGESLLLRRLGGRVELSDEDGFWSPERAALLG